MSKTARLAHTMENLSLLKVEMAKKDTQMSIFNLIIQ